MNYWSWKWDGIILSCCMSVYVICKSSLWKYDSPTYMWDLFLNTCMMEIQHLHPSQPLVFQPHASHPQIPLLLSGSNFSISFLQLKGFSSCWCYSLETSDSISSHNSIFLVYAWVSYQESTHCGTFILEDIHHHYHHHHHQVILIAWIPLTLSLTIHPY